MKDINNTILVGRLTRTISDDPKDSGHLQTGLSYIKFSIAVNSSKKNESGKYEDVPNFFDVQAYGKLAENLKPYLQKGTQVVIKGSLKQERWEKDGKTNSRIVVNADDIQLIGGKGKQGDSSGSKESSGGSSNPQGEMDFPEDVPF